MESLKQEIQETISTKPKKCILCEEKVAQYHIKGRPKDCYCKECALEHFSSLDYLEKN